MALALIIAGILLLRRSAAKVAQAAACPYVEERAALEALAKRTRTWGKISLTFGATVMFAVLVLVFVVLGDLML